VPTVASLHVYPIKSCRGLDLTAVRFDELGPLYDRRFMVVDAQGAYLTQRALPRMALIAPKLGPTALIVTAPDMPQLKVAMSQRDAKRIEVQVWRHRGPAEDCGESAADWFSSFLGQPCRLVRWADDQRREVNPKYARSPAATAFSDGYPVLLLSEASLADLNGRLQQRLPMNRFRPNLVVRDCEAFAEDSWRKIGVGELELDVVKPCDRCAITTVDQLTGVAGKEPLATLASYRTRENQVLFGQNCVHLGFGSIRVGDPVEVLETA
jgi:uncharacterized protein YcbX